MDTTALVAGTVEAWQADTQPGGGAWVDPEAEQERARALRLCRGTYQRAIVHGSARLSGAGLSGRARSYSACYARSRRNLLDRIDAAGISAYIVAVYRGRGNGRLELRFGCPVLGEGERLTWITSGAR